MPIQSAKWIEFRKAEDEYLTRRYDFMQDEKTMINDLDTALSTASDNETALRFLLDTTPCSATVITLVPKVVDISVDSSNSSAISLARKVLFIYKDDATIKECIQTQLNTYLNDNDDWHYRRIAELYKFLDYKEKLDSFALFCLANTNLEINEVGRDFYSLG